MEPYGLNHVHTGARRMLQRAGDQREDDVGFFARRLNIDDSEAAEAEMAMVISLHDQIAGNAIAFWKYDDDSVSGFQRGTKVPGECIPRTDCQQTIPAPAEHVPHGVETLVEAGDHTSLDAPVTNSGPMQLVPAPESQHRRLLEAAKRRQLQLSQKRTGESRLARDPEEDLFVRGVWNLLRSEGLEYGGRSGRCGGIKKQVDVLLREELRHQEERRIPVLWIDRPGTGGSGPYLLLVLCDAV